MEYNWDSIETGRPELNSSQNFFHIRHVLHEKSAGGLKADTVPKQQQPVNFLNSQKEISMTKNKIAPFKQEMNEKVTIVATKPTIQHQKSGDKENVSANNNNRAILAISIVKKPTAPAGGSKPSMIKNMLKKSMSVPSGPKSSAASIHQPVLKVSTATTNQQGPSSAVVSQATVKRTDTTTIGQRQFEYAEQAKKRKEQLVQKITAEKEKELKVKFHANPAPKFKKAFVVHKPTFVEHKKIAKHNSMPQLTKYTSKENIVPSCGDPDRLKLMEEKKKKTLAKYQEPHVQFKAKPAAVLKKLPFQPVHNISKIIDPKPFKLQLTDRLLMRSEFDRKLHETIAIRKKQEEIRKRLADFEERKVIRQKTEFRAQPNPSRNNLARNYN